MKRVSAEIGGRTLFLETGRLAKQSDGAVYVQYGDTAVLVAANASKEVREGIDFFPLVVEYRERAYAAGKIPGGFFKREGRPTDQEILSARLIDRPIRPLFPKGFKNEVQVIALVVSSDGHVFADVPALIGASAALCLSSIPFAGPVGAVRIGKVNGEFVVNPTLEQVEEGVLNLVVAGTEESIVMVESHAKELSEDEMLKALELAHQEIKKIVALQKELISGLAKEKMEFEPFQVPEELKKRVLETMGSRIKEALNTLEKKAREEALSALSQELMADLPEEEDPSPLLEAFHEVERDLMRSMILDEGKRVDGRGLRDIRPITCEVGVLPRAHGSALFTRGETQALVTTTLGTSGEEQMLDNLVGEDSKSFMVHYNFPPFSVGEVRPIRGVSRREVGHGNLAEKALSAVIPDNDEEFPYTIRVVSDILESNGSSSMATVCGGTLSLMDAGVPISAPVAGIAMGLVLEGERYAVLSDILGMEDHLGDMDFKVAGTEKGITALQMDIKVGGITQEIMKEALMQAHEGRLFILDKMKEALDRPREEISPYAPRIVTIQIDKEKIRDVIGPGGKTIRGITEQTGAKIEIDDSGRVAIAAVDMEAVEKAKSIIENLVRDFEEGDVVTGVVNRIEDYGVFVELSPGKDGLLHISQVSADRVRDIREHFGLGDQVTVKIMGIDEMGRIKLTRRGLTPIFPQDAPEKDSRPPRTGPGGRSSHNRRDDRGDRDRRPRRDRENRNRNR